MICPKYWKRVGSPVTVSQCHCQHGRRVWWQWCRDAPCNRRTLYRSNTQYLLVIIPTPINYSVTASPTLDSRGVEYRALCPTLGLAPCLGSWTWPAYRESRTLLERRRSNRRFRQFVLSRRQHLQIAPFPIPHGLCCLATFHRQLTWLASSSKQRKVRVTLQGSVTRAINKNREQWRPKLEDWELFVGRSNYLITCSAL